LWFLVGGTLNEIFNSLKGSITPPAPDDSGNPEPPIIATWGFQPLAIMEVKTFLWTLWRPCVIGNYFIAYSPFVLTRSYIYSYLTGGIST
jgi:hypothetical protein